MKVPFRILSALSCWPLLVGCPRDLDLSEYDISVHDTEAVPEKTMDGGGGGEESEALSCLASRPLLAPSESCGSYEINDGGICVSSSGGNASFRFETTTPCAGQVTCILGGEEEATFHESETTENLLHHLVLRDLPQEVTLACELGCHCLAGSSSHVLANINVAVQPDSGIRISEILLNPNGSEPAQEFVEIVNMTTFELSIGGWRLSDAPPVPCDDAQSDVCESLPPGYGDLIPEGTSIPPMQPVLLVPMEYNRRDPRDIMPPEGCVIIRLDESLGDRGLRNSGGETVFIVDSYGKIAAFYPNAVGTTHAGASVERVHLDYPDGDPLAWIENPDRSSTPCSL